MSIERKPFKSHQLPFWVATAFCFMTFIPVASGGVLDVNPNDAPAILRGVILGLHDTPVGNAQVMASDINRSRKIETRSNADGTYSLSLEDGPYDLTVSAEGYATGYWGPIRVESQTTQNVSLQPASGLSRDSLWGIIRDSEGRPLPNMTITLRANGGTSVRFPDGASTTTDRTGRFHIAGVPSAYFDIVVSGGGGMSSEFIDIVKLETPCFVDFRTHTPYRREITSDRHVPLTDRPLQARSDSSDTFTARCSVVPETPIDVNDKWYLVNGCGDPCTVNNGPQGEITCKDTSEIRCWEIQVTQGVLYYKYAVHVWANCFTSATGSITFRFTDGEPDTYQLWVFKMGEHSVNFNSKDPKIRRIDYDY
jgi:hypothetical protein